MSISLEHVVNTLKVVIATTWLIPWIEVEFTIQKAVLLSFVVFLTTGFLNVFLSAWYYKKLRQLKAYIFKKLTRK